MPTNLHNRLPKKAPPLLKQNPPALSEPGQGELEMLPDLESLARTWHQRLKEPGMRQLIQAGLVKINPLVERLLEMYPEESSASPPS